MNEIIYKCNGLAPCKYSTNCKVHNHDGLCYLTFKPEFSIDNRKFRFKFKNGKSCLIEI